MSLDRFGATSADRAALARLSRPELLLARIVDERRDRWRVVLDEGEALAEASGRFRHESLTTGLAPVVGDFVGVEVRPAEGRATLHAVLPRRTVLQRKQAGTGHGAQLLAANVDVVLIAMDLDLDWNPRRLERYAAFAWESGAQPVVVLTKADLHAAPHVVAAEAAALVPGVPVLTVSATRGDGLAEVAAALPALRTAVLVGSSGVGKSTLMNALLGHAAQDVNVVRAHDGRGQHTTTQRSLFPLPWGALLIDTPGMRELGLIAAEESVEAAFGDVVETARGCRFRDCAHAEEPGCAVLAAIADGRLAPERLEAFRHLEREAAFQRRKVDPVFRAAEARRWRVLQRDVQRRMRERGKP
jgi:ribosome biogenesis GTPase / thiamine phosphate phosphatase